MNNDENKKENTNEPDGALAPEQENLVKEQDSEKPSNNNTINEQGNEILISETQFKGQIMTFLNSIQENMYQNTPESQQFCNDRLPKTISLLLNAK
jgi:hypothetical protein